MTDSRPPSSSMANDPKPTAPREGATSASSAPAITLPKGGGAMRGIGEKFAANPVTGTGAMSVPIATSPGRSNLGPVLSLSYDSGSGNSPFGLGWRLSASAIVRRTDKGLPQYFDAQESDVFQLAGVEDLVPVSAPDEPIEGYLVRRYRPRIETAFARIERWSHAADPRDIHWRVLSKENILTIYGGDGTSRIADPEAPERIFSWLICESRDDKGNAVLYKYKGEDGEGADLSRVSERNRGGRDDPRRTVNRYLKHIYYGNRTPLLDAAGRRPRFLDAAQISAAIANADWMFEVVFDYGEHDSAVPNPADQGAWTYRADPFSTYRAGFEVRTTRLCRRVLMFHHFPEQTDVGRDCLVGSHDFTYLDDGAGNTIYTFLQGVTQTRYRRAANGYDRRSLPPLEFEYTTPIVDGAVREADPDSLENLPIGLGGAYRWTDLHGEGAPGILTEHEGAWYYKRNLSPLGVAPVSFAPLERAAVMPNIAAGAGQFLDLAGDGRPDLVVMDGPTPGSSAHDEAEGWAPFRAFTSRLNRNLGDPNVRLIDLDGDGRADVLITEQDAFVWHESLAEQGFGPARVVRQAIDDEQGPKLVFSDGTQSIHLADVGGDGLNDLVRIRNGEVCYWPNLGHGRFGAKVTMDRSPWFDAPDQFDEGRVRLADIDGSGTTDLIYLHADGPRVYFNESGNRWSAPHTLAAFPPVDNLSSVQVIDLFGNGTACLVWSTPLPGHSRRSLRYVDLMGGQKPHLLVRIVNNLGAETRVQFAVSTKFYLQDRYAGRPWRTRLPFPVHVVERIETFDYISRSRFVTRYAYHHGYFDGAEREFRGFGLVEQWDTEQLSALVESDALPTSTNIAADSHVPPVYTKTWFHTGAYVDGARMFDGREYFREPGLSDAEARALLLPDTILPPGLNAVEERDACRALKGSLVRQETYALDGSDREPFPYTVLEQNFTVRALQPRGRNRHGVFLTHARETITFNYERNPADPRIQHALTLEVDDFGNVLKSATIGYGRRDSNPALAALSAEDRLKQTTILASYTEARMTNSVETDASYRTPVQCESAAFELTGYSPTGPAGRFQSADLVEPDPDLPGRRRQVFLSEVAYEETAAGSRVRRLTKRTRALYRRDDLAGLLPLGALESLAVPGETYTLAFTPGLVSQAFVRRQDGGPPEQLLPDPSAVLDGQDGDRGGYAASQACKADGRFPASDPDDHWWIPSGRSFFSTSAADDAAAELAAARQHFFLARRYRDAFGQDSLVDFDAHDLLIAETRDALGNRVTVDAHDYRVLQPRAMSDPNRNRTVVAFDVLGCVAGTAVMGKPLPAAVEGDSLEAFSADLSQAEIDAFHDAPDPRDLAAGLLGSATTRVIYDVDRFSRTQQAHPSDPSRWQPAYTAQLTRETHVSDPLPSHGLRIQIAISYSDGFNREIQQKLPGGPGPVVSGGAMVAPRWVASGWTIFNNKGQPVRQYEPFFSATPRFEFGVQAGVSPVLFYDPAGRVIARLHPNRTYEKVVFDPWQTTTYDATDTVAPRNAQTGDPRSDPDIAGYVAAYFNALPADPAGPWQTWREQRVGGARGADEQDAAVQASAHADTPTTVLFDTMGRAAATVVRNRVVLPNHPLDGTETAVISRVDQDIDGNLREMRDGIDPDGNTQGRVVARFAYDLLGRRLQQLSMEAGGRWTLKDVGGQPIRTWDDRGHAFTTTYDVSRRPLRQFVRGTTSESDPATRDVDVLVDVIDYGEAEPDAEALNLRTRVVRHRDGAGVATSAAVNPETGQLEAYDFKGRLRRSSRQLVREYRRAPNWAADPALEPDLFVTATTFDALDRPVVVTTPDNSVMRAEYGDAGLLQRLEGRLKGAAETTTFVDDITYDAKGQRQRIDFGNGVTTRYEYDPLTFRLTHLQSMRGAEALQDLSYTFDPPGNLTTIRDEAQQSIFFNNRRVDPGSRYVYDATYRLIQASGREHLGQNGGAPFAPAAASYHDRPRTRLLHPADGNAMGTYVEQYVYDTAGNFTGIRHRGSDPAHPGWTRAFEYDEPSLIEPGSTSNRLSRTTIGGSELADETYLHDAHGNMVRLPHLQALAWSFRDQLIRTDRQQVNAQDEEGMARQGERTFYTYDSDGRRVRKVTERPDGQIKDERLYLAGFEIHRRTGPNAVVRETLHVADGARRLALVETRVSGDDGSPARLIRYQFANHVGSSALELDDQAQVVSYEEYTPYGSTSYQAVRSQTEAPKRYRYTSMERDDETGLSYHSARYYAAWLGRWTSADPAGLTGGVNLYQYGRDNPLNYTDPQGTQPKPDDDDPANWESTAAGGGLDEWNEPAKQQFYRMQEQEAREARVLANPLLPDIEALLVKLFNAGLPTGYLDEALPKIKIEELDPSSDITAYYLPDYDTLDIRATSLEIWFGPDGKPGFVGQATLFHEMFHAYRDRVNDAALDFAFSEGVDDYKQRYPDLSEGNVEELLEEDAASYLGMKVGTYWAAYASLTIAARAGTLDMATYDRIRRDYNAAMKTTEGLGYYYTWLGTPVHIERSKRDDPSLPSALKDYIDDSLLEGKMPDQFDQAEGLTSFLFTALATQAQAMPNVTFGVTALNPLWFLNAPPR